MEKRFIICDNCGKEIDYEDKTKYWSFDVLSGFESFNKIMTKVHYCNDCSGIKEKGEIPSKVFNAITNYDTEINDLINNFIKQNPFILNRESLIKDTNSPMCVAIRLIEEIKKVINNEIKNNKELQETIINFVSVEKFKQL